MLIIILFMLVIIIIVPIANNTMHKCCIVKLQVVYDNITHVMLYYYESFNMHCIAKHDGKIRYTMSCK